MVAVNGCEIVHCDSLVKEAMGKYWSNSKRHEDLHGHFVRRSFNIKDYTYSEVVDRLVDMDLRLTIMKSMSDSSDNCYIM